MKKYLKFLIVAIAGVIPVIVFAQTQATISVSAYIPGAQNVSTEGPCGWIVNFYTFALIVSGILAFGAIVYGGFLYATSAGNASRQGEGRSWIWSALIGLLLLAGAYVILYTINPGLTSCQISLSGVQTVATSGNNGGNTTTGSPGNTSGGTTPSTPHQPSSAAGGKCQAPPTGPCSSAQIQGSCMGSNSQTAAGVCNVESSGNTNAQGDKGDDGNYASIGLFQINLSANTIQDPSTGQTLNCPSAFSNPYTGSNPHTHVVNQSLYQQCVAAAKNPATNIQKACSLSKGGTSWSLWGPSTKSACGL